jgi:hypothetical protein
MSPVRARAAVIPKLLLNWSLQVFQEETEFQQGIDDVRGRRRAAGAAGASQQLSQAAMIAQQEQQAATQLKDAALLYARCLQHLLKVRWIVLLSRVRCRLYGQEMHTAAVPVHRQAGAVASCNAADGIYVGTGAKFSCLAHTLQLLPHSMFPVE